MSNIAVSLWKEHPHFFRELKLNWTRWKSNGLLVMGTNLWAYIVRLRYQYLLGEDYYCCWSRIARWSYRYSTNTTSSFSAYRFTNIWSAIKQMLNIYTSLTMLLKHIVNNLVIKPLSSLYALVKSWKQTKFNQNNYSCYKPSADESAAPLFS